jgi:hypothetical protein
MLITIPSLCRTATICSISLGRLCHDLGSHLTLGETLAILPYLCVVVGDRRWPVARKTLMLQPFRARKISAQYASSDDLQDTERYKHGESRSGRLIASRA